MGENIVNKGTRRTISVRKKCALRRHAIQNVVLALRRRPFSFESNPMLGPVIGPLCAFDCNEWPFQCGVSLDRQVFFFFLNLGLLNLHVVHAYKCFYFSRTLPSNPSRCPSFSSKFPVVTQSNFTLSSHTKKLLIKGPTKFTFSDKTA